MSRGRHRAVRCPAGLARVLRYGGVSVVCALLAQAGLAVGYGMLRWGPVAAVGLSLAVSVGPSYVLNRRWVWPASAGGLRRLTSFVALALAGSAFTAVVASGADAFGRRLTTSHAALTGMVNISALCATAAVWAVRYVVLNRLLFAAPRVGHGLLPE